jgi:hypothetical protein
MTFVELALTMSLLSNVVLFAVLQQNKYQLTLLKDNARRFEKY